MGLASIFLAGLWGLTGTAVGDPVYAPLVAGNTQFALDMYHQLAEGAVGNIFFSPYSISSCLGMVYDGAAGNTAQQMAVALSFSTNQSDVGTQFAALDAELSAQQGQDGISLNIANGLWAQQNFPFLPSFFDNATSNFDADVQQVDFVTYAPLVTYVINQWVGTKTQGMISNLFAPGALNSSTVMALVNAIYFKGAWLNPFDTNLTMSVPFHVSSTKTVNTPMMNQYSTAPMFGNSLLQAVELPYANSNLVMIVLLPNDANGLAQMEAALTPQELATVINGLRPSYGVPLSLPKFSLSMTANLIPPLKNLLMVDAFEPGVADFSGMDGKQDLSIQVATHKAVVEVDEAGTTAAGATGIGVIPTVLFGVFNANHPFVFLIYDTISGSILFMGRVVDPTNNGPSPAVVAGPRPLIQMHDGNFGLRGNQFGFTIAGTNNSVIVEVCTNANGGSWYPVQTLTPNNGSAYFSETVDPAAPLRFYRVRLP